MCENNETAKPPAPIADRQRPRISDGYRQGLITAITVVLGFSLAFLRFWGLQAPGQWTWRSATSTATSIIAVGLELFALFRSLRPEDENENEYRKTVGWFLASVILLVLGLLFALIESSLG